MPVGNATGRSAGRVRTIGLTLVLVSTVLWSTVGYFVRLADADTWTIVLWRSLFAAAALVPFWLATSRNRMAALRMTLTVPGLVAIGLGVVGNITYIVALHLTTVATVMTIYAALPFLTAGIAFFALREQVSGRFLLAALVAVAGIAVMAGAAVSGRDLAGIAVSILMTGSYAGYLVLVKKRPGLDMTLVSIISALGGALAALPLVPHGPQAGILPGTHALMVCALLGVLTTGLANVLTLVGSRDIGSGEAGFLLLLDIVLGPFWVWLAFGETVGPSVLAGGTLVVAAVAWYLMGGDSRRTAPATSAESAVLAEGPHSAATVRTCRESN
ncbi:DMT family transporter [Ancylobacter sp. 6x-1]|uniref:DMT family transporter n=1 Tax=Ancylobacter crimeensis TaxID=2579147 RepID=A0ABT0DFG2_9HYPH|nr:DMT family transporter [Ancylobacter crimeensis]MCK0198693.1 DMT family transporter [Ancylobacter crimeensis]